MRQLLIVFALLSTSPALSAELTLNDLPTIIQSLRLCIESKGIFGSEPLCAIPKDDLWVSIASDGSLTLFQQKTYDNTTYARGANIRELLQNYAAKLNRQRDLNKGQLDALGPYLATQ